MRPATLLAPNLGSVSINLSTTARGADGLSTVFADNIGSDATAVIPQGPLQIFGGPSINPNVAIPFTTPFYYDPSQGNLLIDIRNFGFVPNSFPQQYHPPPMDARDVFGDTVSRVWAGNANALSGTADTLGLTMLITFVPVPEPSTWALLGLGLAALAWRGFSRLRRHRHS